MSLYRDDILDHYRHPQNFGKPEHFTHSCEQGLQACGDRQMVYLTIENDVIIGSYFEGSGCAISIAASSLVSEYLKGKTIEELSVMNEDTVVKLLGSPVATGRIDCAVLGLKSFQKAITSPSPSFVGRGQEEISSPYEGEDEGGVIYAQNEIASSNLAKPVYVTKDSNLGEIAAKYPQAARVFTEYGLHRVGCFASAFDSVEAGASMHGMSTEEIEDMIRRANEVCLADDESRREIERHPKETLSHESGIMNHAKITPPYS